MKKLYSTIFALGLCVLTTESFASIDFSDNFENESDNSTRNYNLFGNWNVTDGSVDLVSEADGGFGISCSDSTKCLDLDGSTGNSGILTTKQNFELLEGTYELTFALAGNPLKKDANSVQVSLGDIFSEEISLAGNEPFMTFTREISVTAATSGYLSFANQGGDNHGAILDNVTLKSIADSTTRTSAVPLPQAGWLFLSGILGFSVFRKKPTK
jgi:hypothetical protein